MKAIGSQIRHNAVIGLAMLPATNGASLCIPRTKSCRVGNGGPLPAVLDSIWRRLVLGRMLDMMGDSVMRMENGTKSYGRLRTALVCPRYKKHAMNKVRNGR